MGSAAPLPYDPVPQVGRRWRRQDVDRLEPEMSLVAIREHRRPAAEQHRYQMDLDLVDQAGAEVLPAEVGAAHHSNVLAAGYGPRLPQRAFETVGHEPVHATRRALLG